MENQTVTVNQVPYEYNQDFESIQSVGKIEGLTNENKHIIFLDCNFLGGDYRAIYSNIVFTIKGFLLLDNEDDVFNSISFSAKALNTFYSPQHAIKHDPQIFSKRFDGSLQLKILPTDDYKQVFECDIDGEEISNELKVQWNINLKFEESNLGYVHTIFLMKFKDKKSSENLKKYYLYLYDFLTFILFRKNHHVDEIILFEDDKKVGVANFFQKEEDLNYSVLKSICFNDIGTEYIYAR